MTFSVIVPVYNVEKYLPKCLDSLLHQTYKDMEVILVDDGSTDNSGIICDDYASKYSLFSVIHQINHGLSAARNCGIEHAKGEWIAFVDGDDWVSNDLFEKLMGCILVTNAETYRFQYQLVNENDNNVFPLRHAQEYKIYDFSEEENRFDFYERTFLRFHVGWSAWGAIYRHDIIEKHQMKFIDTQIIYAEDLLFSFQYLLYVHKMVLLDDELYYYRARKNSLVNTIQPRQMIIRTATLGEYAYHFTVDADLSYFKKNFYRLYFQILDFHIRRCEGGLSDTQIREVLDELEEKDFHRKCMEKIRSHARLFRKYTEGKTSWYEKGYGRKIFEQERIFSARISNVVREILFCPYILMENIIYSLRGTNLSLYDYFYDKEQKVAYLANSKAACSSIRVSMFKGKDIPDDYSIDWVVADQQHLKQPFHAEGWYTFTFVRNPFERLVSCYESKYHKDKKYGFCVYLRYLHGYMKEDKGFSNFIDQVCKIPSRLAEKHFRSQYDLIIGKDGLPIVDFIGKVENLPYEYEPIRSKYNYDPLMVYNKASYGDWRDYYTTKLAKKVYRKYKDEVIYFGYEHDYKELLAYCAKKENQKRGTS